MPFLRSIFALFSALATINAAPELPEKVDFNTHIRPIFNKNCTACHGGVKQAGELSFIYREMALKGGESGERAIVPGKPAESEIIRRIRTDDKDDRMPPIEEHPEGITAGELALLEKWIEQGAVWGDHWSFVPPEPTALPKVKNTAWAHQDLDRFILARLESEGLAPSPAASPAQWLRRASFALTGLAPTTEELDAFLAATKDPAQAEKAYGAGVDRLLASPRFGERWTAVWLDLARYADSMGYEKDLARTLWPFRDWLIRAFNDGMPYDEFTRKILAGDLLPNPTMDDYIATGFQRSTQTNTEGGTDDEEFRIAAMVDRVSTTWTVWQGLTFGCVQCHSHPYDPFPHEEYYQFASFYNSATDCDRKNDYPTLRVPNAAADKGRVLAQTRELEQVSRDLMEPFQALAADSKWDPLQPDHFWDNKTQSEMVPTKQDGRDIIVVEGTPAQGAIYEVVGNPATRRVEAIRVESFLAPGTSAHSPSAAFVVTKFELRLRRAGNAEPGKDFELIPHRFVALDESNGQFFHPQWGVFPNQFHRRWAAVVPTTPIELGAGDSLSVVLHQTYGRDGAEPPVLRRFAISTTADPGWSRRANNPEHAKSLANRKSLVETLKKTPGVNMPVMQERLKFPRVTAVFKRGNWMDKGTIVQPGFPKTLAQSGQAATPRNRLDMALWIANPANPLTARVEVNRVWAQLFGIGLVETLEDFGSTGTPPSHPALLDYLALRFQGEHRWQLKSLLRELVLSAAFRQDHRSSPELLEADPKNRLLSRGPRLRLSAEMVRDHALSAAGLLSPKMHGPPVMPPQPEGLWKVVYSGQKWVTPSGEDRYRRGLYTYWRRSAPYPSFETFDVPERRVCSARRIPTNTPLHALVTLNDPVYLEASHALSKRMQAAGEFLPDQLRFAYRLATSSPADSATVIALAQLHNDLLKEFEAHPEDSKKLAATPSDAAYTILANTILNLDPALTQ